MTCTRDDCWCYPHYGYAPGVSGWRELQEPLTVKRRDGSEHTIPTGTIAHVVNAEPAPRDTWPANFREDPDAPGLGSWYCPDCLAGIDEVPS